jgi:hypothetical protein
MSDLIFVAIIVLFFVVTGLYVRFREKTLRMETIVVGIIALLLFASLFIAMIRPAKVAVHLHA